ncbi:unnamed protein product [Camellia sinensis]
MGKLHQAPMDSMLKPNQNTNKTKKKTRKLNLKPNLEQIHTGGIEEENPTDFHHGGKKAPHMKEEIGKNGSQTYLAKTGGKKGRERERREVARGRSSLPLTKQDRTEKS